MELRQVVLPTVILRRLCSGQTVGRAKPSNCVTPMLFEDEFCWQTLPSGTWEIAMSRSTFLLRFQEKCEDTPADSTLSGGTGDMAFETGTRSRETTDQHASNTALSGGMFAQLRRTVGRAAPESPIDPSWGAGTSATKARETTDQHRADDALGTSTTKTGTRETSDVDVTHLSYRTFSW